MPLQKLQLRPGINREGTSLANEGGWFECDKVRFRSGYPEKIGGWAALSYNTFLGVARSLWNWITLKGFNLLGVGTNLKFYIEDGGEYYDITPIRLSTTGTVTFVAVDGSSIITVTDTAATSLQESDFVTFSSAVSLGGNITAAVLNQEYQIATLLSNIGYTVQVAVTANSSDVGNGGAATDAAYQLSTGAAAYTVGTGWGTSPYGGFIFGTSSSNLSGAIDDVVTTITVVSTTTFAASGTIQIDGELITYAGKTATDFTGCVRGVDGTTAAPHVDATPTHQVTSAFTGWGVGFSTGAVGQLRLWSQVSFGEQLLINPRGGAIYVWQVGADAVPDYDTQRAVQVSATSVTPMGWTPVTADVTCPDLVDEILVSDAARIVFAFGCNDPSGTLFSVEKDPMLVRWSSQETYLEWVPTPINQAGSYRLSHGSKIVGVLQTRQELLVWTDAALYGIQYLGPPYVWGFTYLSDNISVISPNAMATAGGVTFWMGTDKFYTYSGRVETLPSAVRTYVFDNINRDQDEQVFASTNEGFSEVWWFYCSKNALVPDRYVIFNYLDRVWYYGDLDRTAWLDSALRQYPMAATGNTNLIVYHEAAVDDGTTNPPSPISAYVQSSDFDIGDGHNYGFVWRLIPDITFDGSVNPTPEDPTLTSSYPTVRLQLRPRTNPGAPYGVNNAPDVRSSAPNTYIDSNYYNVQLFTEIVYTRARGRQMAFRVESNTLGTQWQLGVPRIDVRPDGRR